MIATASTESKRALALELGADVAVDVTRDDLTTVLIQANGRRVDVVLEMAGGRVQSGDLRVVEGPVYPLSEARRAREDHAGPAHHRQAAS